MRCLPAFNKNLLRHDRLLTADAIQKETVVPLALRFCILTSLLVLQRKENATGASTAVAHPPTAVLPLGCDGFDARR